MESGNIDLKNRIRASIALRKIRIKLITGEKKQAADMLEHLDRDKSILSDKYNNSIYLLLKALYFYNITDYDSAYKYYMSAAEMKTELGDKSGYASCIMNMANLECKRGNNRHAVKLYEEAESIYSQLNQEWKWGNCVLNKLLLLLKYDLNSVNPEQFKKLEMIFQKNNLYKSQIVLYQAVADYHNYKKNGNDPMQFINKGMKLAQRINDIYNYANLFLKKGIYKYYTGQKIESRDEFIRGLKILENYDGYNQLKLILHYNIADVSDEIGDIDIAEEHFRHVMHLDKSKSDMYDDAQDFFNKYTKEEK